MPEVARRAFITLRCSDLAIRRIRAEERWFEACRRHHGFADNDEVWQAYLATGRVVRQPDPARRKSGDLPVQLPLKYELVINLKTAAAGLIVPSSLQLLADHLIE